MSEQKTQKKHRIILRDNIQGITKPAIQRMAYRAGIKSLGGLMYEEVRGHISKHVDDIIRRSLVFMENSRRRTIQEKDVRAALTQMGRPIAFATGTHVVRQIVCKTKKEGDEGEKVISRTVKKYNTKQFGGDGVEQEQEQEQEQEYEQEEEQEEQEDYISDTEGNDSDDEEYDVSDQFIDSYQEPQSGGGLKKPHRFHPGTVALRNIRKLQKQPGTTYCIRKLPFQRFVREIAQDHATDLRFSVDALLLTQLATETYCIDLLRNANLLTINAKRIRVQPKDITTAQKVYNHVNM